MNINALLIRTFILMFVLVLHSNRVLFGLVDAKDTSVTDTVGKNLEDSLNYIIDSVTAFPTKFFDIIMGIILTSPKAKTSIWENCSGKGDYHQLIRGGFINEELSACLFTVPI